MWCLLMVEGKSAGAVAGSCWCVVGRCWWRRGLLCCGAPRHCLDDGTQVIPLEDSMGWFSDSSRVQLRRAALPGCCCGFPPAVQTPVLHSGQPPLAAGRKGVNEHLVMLVWMPGIVHLSAPACRSPRCWFAPLHRTQPVGAYCYSAVDAEATAALFRHIHSTCLSLGLLGGMPAVPIERAVCKQGLQIGEALIILSQELKCMYVHCMFGSMIKSKSAQVMVG